MNNVYLKAEAVKNYSKIKKLKINAFLSLCQQGSFFKTSQEKSNYFSLRDRFLIIENRIVYVLATIGWGAFNVDKRKSIPPQVLSTYLVQLFLP